MQPAGSNVGVWIDSRKAVVMTLFNGEVKTQVIYSGADTRPRFKGETSLKRKRGFSGYDYESSQQNHLSEELKKFFRQVAGSLDGAASIYLFGPGEARLGLEKAVSEMPQLKGKIADTETCDYLTDNQMAERVRKFFYHYKGLAASTAFH